MSDHAPLDRRFLLGGLAGAAGISALAAMTKAGPLTPPSGTVAATGKTLTDVEPRIAVNNTNTPGDADSLFRIAQSGSYYLTGNIVVSAKNAIKIAASGVTLDLNGFAIIGFGGLGGIIPSSTAIERITIRNGSISTLPYGILFTDVPDITVEHIRCETIPGYAIRTGERGTIRGCTVVSCGGGGGAAGSYAVRVDRSSLVEGCTIAETSGWGLSADFGSRVVDCIVTGSTVVGMSVYGSVIGCTVRGNGSSGMQVQDGAVIGCVAEQNGGIGIAIDHGAVIDCQSKGNSTGIVLGQRSLVRGCVCTLNDNAGIAANFNANRIESNTCIENDTGIQATDTNGRSVITGNTCIDSRVVAFNIASGNVCQVIAAATTGAINGNSGGVSPGSTSAWANFAV